MTRRVDEGLVIGDDVHVTVLEIGEDYVRLAISASHEIPSYWEETLYLNRDVIRERELQMQ